MILKRVKRVYKYMRSNSLGLVAIVIALSGTAVAAKTASRNSVTSKSIKNETVKDVDIKSGAIRSAEVADSTLSGADVSDNSLTGADIAEPTLQIQGAVPSGPAGGALTGTYPNPQLAAPGIGARAFGSVESDGTLTASKNATVTHPSNGVYCVTVAPSVTEPRLLMATMTAGNGATSINSGNIGLAIGGVPNVFPASPCPLGSHQVTTLVYNGDEVDDDNGGGNTAGGLIVLDDEPFAFVIP